MMALLAKSFDEVKGMSERQRTMYFEHYAAYIPDAPKMCYAIRIGSRTLHSNDTHDLRQQFDKLLRYGINWKGPKQIGEKIQ